MKIYIKRYASPQSPLPSNVLKQHANKCNNSQQCWDLQFIVGRIQPISLCKPCVMQVRGPTMLEELSKRLQYCCATLRWSQNKLLGFVGSNVWLVWLWATIPNNTEQHAETTNRVYLPAATCYIQQYWELLAYNVVPVCTGLCTLSSWYSRLTALVKQAINSLCHSGGLPNISVVSLMGDFCRTFEV